MRVEVEENGIIEGILVLKREKIKRRVALQLSQCVWSRIYHLVAGARKEIK